MVLTGESGGGVDFRITNIYTERKLFEIVHDASWIALLYVFFHVAQSRIRMHAMFAANPVSWCDPYIAAAQLK